MSAQSIQVPRELELLKLLIGDWVVGIALRTDDSQVVSGCGEMNAVEILQIGINSEMTIRIDGYDEVLENDLWSFDRKSGKVHLFSVTADGDGHDHIGKLKDPNTIELSWKGKYEEEELEENLTAKFVTKDQIELRETARFEGKTRLTTDYIFKRKEV